MTRRYHGLLIAALQPPVGRTLLLSQVDETIVYHEQTYALATHRWANGMVSPKGYQHLEQFHLEGTTPVWSYAIGDALLEKRIWMQPRVNTTYLSYRVQRSSGPLVIAIKALVNYRDYHGITSGHGWEMAIAPISSGVKVLAFDGAYPFYLFSNQGEFQTQHYWYQDFDLPLERYRGLSDREDHLYGARLNLTLNAGETLLIVASTTPDPNLNLEQAICDRRAHDHTLLTQAGLTINPSQTPDWVSQLVLAADQFVVDRPLPDESDGKTIIAGYPWFSDWGRDTMISLPGLTLATGREAIARTILKTFASYLDQGMLPNVFPDAGSNPDYNTVDATLWFIEAIRAYIETTQDQTLLPDIWSELEGIIDWHRRGTRYHIHLDNDGLIYAGKAGVQLTWMDAKVGDWVVTPRIGKPIEINALWYNALCIMADFAQQLGKSAQDYQIWAAETRAGFQRFWSSELRHCLDCLDGPDGNDAALRPNQIFAVSLNPPGASPLLSSEQQQAVVQVCAQHLLTSHGLRSLSPDHPQYVGRYGGGVLQRDGGYHQGTAWGWLLGSFIQAHYNIYGDIAAVRKFLQPMIQHLQGGCVGTLSEIFDGDAPMHPRGCFAQAWTVAEILRIWHLLSISDNSKSH